MKTDAEKYDRNNALQIRDAELLIERIKLEFPEYKSWSSDGNLTILDIGCGSGNVTESLFEAFKPSRLIGIDSSQSMIDYARKHHSRSSTIEYYSADCTMDTDRLTEMLNIIPGTIDLIVSIYCLHWVENIGNALRNIRAFLRPITGRYALIVSVWSDLFPVQHRIVDNPEWRSKLQQWIGERLMKENMNTEKIPATEITTITTTTTTNTTQLTAFGVQNKPEIPIVDSRWRSMIQKAGLELENISFTNVNYHYTTLESFHEQVEIVSYWFEFVPEAFQDQFRRDYFRLIDQEYVTNNTDSVRNTVRFNYTYLTITGTSNHL